MPRVSRQKSKSGIYHIMLRGVNKMQIFLDEEDCIRFLETLLRFKDKSLFKVFGWCLMGNHAHLLLKEGSEDISNSMKRITVSYVNYFTKKYKHTGHLFQDRYKSEAIENDSYLLTAIRYIHQNPVKAELASISSEWKWSSCKTYYSEEQYPKGLLDKDFILSLFSNNVNKFKIFNDELNGDKCLDAKR